MAPSNDPNSEASPQSQMKFPVSGPLLLSHLPKLTPSQTHVDSISPCWGELESQPGGKANATGPTQEAPPGWLRSHSQAACLVCWWTPQATATLLPALTALAARGTWTTRPTKSNPVPSHIQN